MDSQNLTPDGNQIRIGSKTHRKLKIQAAIEGKTLSEVIDSLLPAEKEVKK